MRLENTYLHLLLYYYIKRVLFLILFIDIIIKVITQLVYLENLTEIAKYFAPSL